LTNLKTALKKRVLFQRSEVYIIHSVC